MPTSEITFAAICLVVALAPVPLGSNRPFFWFVNALIVALLTIGYVIARRASSSPLRVPLARVALPAFLYMIAPVWMMIQVLPLPWLHLTPDLWGEAGQALGRPLAARISGDPAATIGMVVRWITLALFYFLVMEVTVNRDRSRRLFEVLFWVIVVHAAIALIMLFEFGDRLLFFWPKWAYQGAATGFFVNRNSFATFVGCGLIIGVVLTLDREWGRRRVGGLHESWLHRFRDEGAHLAGIVVLISAMFLSTSRAGAVSAGIGVLIAFALAARRGSERFGFMPFFAILGGVALFVLLFSGKGLTDRLGSTEVNLDERLLLYRQVLEMIVERPWTGFGGGTFAEAFQLVHRLPLNGDVIWNAAHNSYLELFADLGFAAVAPILAFVLLFLQQVRSINSSEASAWVPRAAAVAAFVAVALHSLVDFPLQVEANSLLVTAILAAGTAQSLHVNRRARF